MAKLKPWAESALKRITDRLPELRVGDVWEEIPNDGDRVVIERIEVDETSPFPMVHFRRLDGHQDLDPRMGAPMFMFGRLVERGQGEAWRPNR